MSTQSPPVISVLVPAHNAAATLGDCLTALAAGGGPPHEVVVVDDGSTDATAEIAARFGVRLVRLRRQSGAAVARNVAARHASADLLFFVDADVLVTPGAVARAVAVLERRPDVSAVFGSYTAHTVHTNFSSVYKNLVHHLTHQAARPEATTFWSGAGAIRRDAFWSVGGFDPADTRTSDVEDIALGYRLTRAGFRILLDRDLQVTHAKRYTLWSMICSDVLHRSIPWTRLMLRERMFRRDLNTSDHGLASAASVMLVGPSLLGGMIYPPLQWVSLGLVALYLSLNRRLFVTVARYNARFLLPAVAVTALYYVYAAAGAVAGVVLYLRDPHPPASHPSREPDLEIVSQL